MPVIQNFAMQYAVTCLPGERERECTPYILRCKLRRSVGRCEILKVDRGSYDVVAVTRTLILSSIQAWYSLLYVLRLFHVQALKLFSSRNI